MFVEGEIMESDISLSIQEAYKLCQVHREKHKPRLFSQCWGCVKYSKENPERMCLYKPPTNDGCQFVNRLYERQRNG